MVLKASDVASAFTDLVFQRAVSARQMRSREALSLLHMAASTPQVQKVPAAAGIVEDARKLRTIHGSVLF